MEIEYNKWIKVTDELVTFISGKPEFQPILGYSKDWIDEDFNVNGFRECCFGEWLSENNNPCLSAKWSGSQDCWYDDDKTMPTHILIPSKVEE